jgi:adenine-specific DNA methylase
MISKKKLIEVALPLEAINKASAREKSIRHEAGAILDWCRMRTLCEPEVRDGRR